MRFSKLILIPLLALVAILQTASPVLGQERINPDAEANIQIDQNAAASDQFLKNNPAPKPAIESNTKLESCNWGVDLSCAILWSINRVLDGITYYPIYFISSVFVTTIELNSGKLLTSNEGIQKGWEISRDFVNLFFIIVLIFIALGTIFDLSSFNRNLIFKVVLIALTINFSMAIAQFVVSQANNLGLFFLGQISIAQEASSKTNEINYSHGVAKALGDMVNFDAAIKASTGKLQQTIFKTGDNGEVVRQVWETYEITIPALFVPRGLTQELRPSPKDPGHYIFPARLCNDVYLARSNACLMAKDNFQDAVTQTHNPNAKLAFSIAMKIIIIPVALFILLAAAILMIGRIVFLSFLMMFAPFYFFSVLLPNYNKFSKWWQDLLNQAFFFPAFMFVFMLSIIFFQKLQATTPGPIETLISYFIGVFLLGFSLITAQSMGAVGASAAISYGKKARNATLNYAKGRAQQGTGVAAKHALGMLAPAAETKFGRIATAPLRLGLEKTTLAGKKVSDKREEDRVKRISQSIEANPEMGAKVFRTFRESDQKEWAKKATEKQFGALSEHLSVEEMVKIHKNLDSEQAKSKLIAGVKAKGDESATERRAWIQMGGKPADGPRTAEDQAKHEMGFAQAVAMLPVQQLRKISEDELKSVQELRKSVELLANDKNVIRHIANTEGNAKQFSNIVFQMAGYSPEHTEALKKRLLIGNQDEKDKIHRDLINELKSQSRDTNSQFHKLAEKLEKDGNYQNTVLYDIPMSSRFVELPQGAGVAAAAAGGAGTGAAGGGGGTP